MDSAGRWAVVLFTVQHVNMWRLFWFCTRHYIHLFFKLWLSGIYEMYGLWNLDIELASHCPRPSHSCSMNSRRCREQNKWIKSDTAFPQEAKARDYGLAGWWVVSHTQATASFIFCWSCSLGWKIVLLSAQLIELVMKIITMITNKVINSYHWLLTVFQAISYALSCYPHCNLASVMAL